MKHGNEDHPLDQKYVVFVDRWSSFSGHSTCDMNRLSWPSVVFVGQRSSFPGFTVLLIHYFSFFNWASWEPNNFLDEDCAVMHIEDNHSDLWGDRPCEIHQASYICQHRYDPSFCWQLFIHYQLSKTNSYFWSMEGNLGETLFKPVTNYFLHRKYITIRMWYLIHCFRFSHNS